MALEVAGVVQNANDIDCVFAAAVDQKMAGRSHNPQIVPRPVAAEVDVIRSNASRQFPPLLGSWPLRVGCDIANRLLEEVPIADGGARAKSLLAPQQDLADISPRGRGSTIHRGRPLSDTLALRSDFGGDFGAKPIEVPFEFVHRAEIQALAPIDLLDALGYGAAQPFQLGALFPLPVFHQPQAFADNFAGTAIAAGADLGFNEPVEAVRQIDVSGRHVSPMPC